MHVKIQISEVYHLHFGRHLVMVVQCRTREGTADYAALQMPRSDKLCLWCALSLSDPQCATQNADMRPRASDMLSSM